MRGRAGAGRSDRPKRHSGAPVEPSFKSVVVRAGVIVAIYYLFLVLVMKTDPTVAAAIAVLGLVVMIPLGYLIDRWRYRRQLRTWQAGRGGPKA